MVKLSTSEWFAMFYPQSPHESTFRHGCFREYFARSFPEYISCKGKALNHANCKRTSRKERERERKMKKKIENRNGRERRGKLNKSCEKMVRQFFRCFFYFYFWLTAIRMCHRGPTEANFRGTMYVPQNYISDGINKVVLKCLMLCEQN